MVRALAVCVFLLFAGAALLVPGLAGANQSMQPRAYLPSVANQPSPTATPVPSPTPSPSPTPVGTELVTNGGFESGLSGWSESGPATITTQNPYQGRYSAQWEASPGNMTPLFQVITIPSCAKTGTLSFATRYITSAGAENLSTEGWIALAVIDPVLGPMLGASLSPEPSKNNVWVVFGYQNWVDVSSIAGHTITLALQSWTNPNLSIYWDVDDVDFRVSC